MCSIDWYYFRWLSDPNYSNAPHFRHIVSPFTSDLLSWHFGFDYSFTPVAVTGSSVGILSVSAASQTRCCCCCCCSLHLSFGERASHLVQVHYVGCIERRRSLRTAATIDRRRLTSGTQLRRYSCMTGCRRLTCQIDCFSAIDFHCCPRLNPPPLKSPTHV